MWVRWPSRFRQAIWQKYVFHSSFVRESARGGIGTGSSVSAFRMVDDIDAAFRHEQHAERAATYVSIST